MSSAIHVVGLGRPDEVREFPHGRFELYRVGGAELGRAVYEPGWRWSEHVSPTAGTAFCEVGHVGFVLSGKAAVQMADGTEAVLAEGDFFAIAPGHDSWVIGQEEYCSLHLSAAGSYVRPAGPAAAGEVDLEGASEFMRLLGLRFNGLGPDHVDGVFEAAPAHYHPWGFVHGGVLASVIETAATTGAYLTVREQGQFAVGVTNATDFIRPARPGQLRVIAEPVHQGRTGQLWETRITRSGDGKLIARGNVRLHHADA